MEGSFSIKSVFIELTRARIERPLRISRTSQSMEFHLVFHNRNTFEVHTLTPNQQQTGGDSWKNEIQNISFFFFFFSNLILRIFFFYLNDYLSLSFVQKLNEIRSKNIFFFIFSFLFPRLLFRYRSKNLKKKKKAILSRIDLSFFIFIKKSFIERKKEPIIYTLEKKKLPIIF